MVKKVPRGSTGLEAAAPQGRHVVPRVTQVEKGMRNGVLTNSSIESIHIYHTFGIRTFGQGRFVARFIHLARITAMIGVEIRVQYFCLRPVHCILEAKSCTEVEACPKFCRLCAEIVSTTSILSTTTSKSCVCM